MDETQGRFLALLQQESTLLDELYQLLKQETKALKEKNIELMNKLLESKNVLLDKLGMLDKQRQLYVEREASQTPMEESMGLKVQEMNRSIQERLDNCKHQNNINGGIIEVTRLFNQKILDIVHGQPDQENTYSAEGKNRTRHTQHSIARV